MNRKQRRAAAKKKGRRPAPAPAVAQGPASAPNPLLSGRAAKPETVGFRRAKSERERSEALLLLGIKASEAGRYGDAVGLFGEALRLKPDFAEAHYNRGLALKEQGKLDEAVAGYKKAIALKPGFAEAHNNLGVALKEQGKLKAAAASYRRAAAVRPGYAAAHNNLGVALKEQGQLDEAIASTRRALAVKPDYAPAHNNLGVALKEQGNIEEAVASYRRALGHRPDYAEAHNNLGVALAESGEPEAAIARYKKAIALKPGFAEAHRNLGITLSAQGKLDEAVASYEKALRLRPDYAEAHRNLGIALGGQGKLRQAIASHEKALKLRPGFAEAHRNLADLKTYGAGDDHLATMEKLLADPSLGDEGRMQLSFALAKAREELGDTGAAFAHLERGNRLKRVSIRYDIAEDEALIEQIVSVFDKTFIARRSGLGCSSGKPIFIVGMPRSGSTLVEQILASHGSVHGGGELRDLHELVLDLERAPGASGRFPELAVDLAPKDSKRLGGEYVDGLRRRAPDARHITDKMLSNFHYVGLIHLILPNAKIIHCVRDPVDTCFSCFTKLFDRGADFAYDLAELGRYTRLYRRLMRHWHEVLPGRILDLGYENLVGNQERETRRLLDHCGLAWDEACLTFHQTRRTVQTASAAEVRRPIYGTSVGRWKRFEKHLGPLLDALGPLATQDGQT